MPWALTLTLSWKITIFDWIAFDFHRRSFWSSVSTVSFYRIRWFYLGREAMWCKTGSSFNLQYGGSLRIWSLSGILFKSRCSAIILFVSRTMLTSGHATLWSTCRIIFCSSTFKSSISDSYETVSSRDRSCESADTIAELRSVHSCASNILLLILGCTGISPGDKLERPSVSLKYFYGFIPYS